MTETALYAMVIYSEPDPDAGSPEAMLAHLKRIADKPDDELDGMIRTSGVAREEFELMTRHSDPVAAEIGRRGLKVLAELH